MLSAVLAVLLLAGGVTTAVLVMDRNGETKAEERQEKQESEAERQEREEEEAEEREAAQAHFDQCTEELDPLVKPLTDVEDQVGSIDQLAFSGLLLDATLAEILMDDQALGTGTCRDVSTQLERTLDTYNEALDDWRACIRDYSCDRTAPAPGVEEQWEQASSELAKAVDLLDTLDPESDAFEFDPEGVESSEGSGGGGSDVGGDDEDDPYEPDSDSDSDDHPFEPGERT